MFSPIFGAKSTVDIIQGHSNFISQMFWQRITVGDFIDEFDPSEEAVDGRFVLSFADDLSFAARPNEPVSVGTGDKLGEQSQQIQTSLSAIQLLAELKRNRRILAQGRRCVESGAETSLERT